MSQELGLCYCMAACWPSKFEASHCTWTSAVGRCLCRGLGHSWSSLTGHLTCWSGEAMRAQGSFFVGGPQLGDGVMGRGLTSHSRTLAWLC